MQLAIHVVQNRHAREQKSHWDKTNKGNYHLKLCMPFVSVSGRGATFALQHGGFVPREWPIKMQRVVQWEKELARSRVEKVLFSVVIWQPLLLYSFRLLSKFHLGVLIVGLSLFFYLIDQGPPEGWRGPEDNFEDGPWHDDERGPYPPGDSPMRGRGKPRGGRRGRGVRR